MLTAQSNTKDYIDRYKSIALQQMIDTDIPASISLAQGILESAVGTSVLATKANNHFGIMCTEDWEGEVIYMLIDNETNCYKVYNSPAESYIEQAKYLTNNTQFENLFYIESNNYKRWAKGLEALKYSNDDNYARQLIEIIELYELDEIDKQVSLFETEDYSAVASDEPIYVNGEDIYYINDIKCVSARESETPLELAARMKIPLRKILKYNDILLSQGFEPGQFVFLGKKKSKFHGEKDVHEVKANDNIYLISQTYGIRLKSLLRLNRLKRGEEPNIGEKISLKAKADKKPVLRSDNIIPKPEKPTIEEEKPTETSPIKIITPPGTKPKPKPEVTLTPPKKSTTKPKPSTNTNTNNPPKKNILYVYPGDPGYENKIVSEEGRVPEKPNNNNSNNTEIPGRTVPTKPTVKVEENIPVPPNTHVVVKGETLYSISRKYNVTVQRIKDLNGLLSNEIEINDYLRYK